MTGDPTGQEITTLAQARAAIDQVDAQLAALLQRRTELAGVVQRLKPVGGFAGRDPHRERQVVESMARHAPGLGRDRLERIMSAVIEAGLELAELEAAGPRKPEALSSDARPSDPRSSDPRSSDPRSSDPRSSDPRPSDPRSPDARGPGSRAGGRRFTLPGTTRRGPAAG